MDPLTAEILQTLAAYKSRGRPVRGTMIDPGPVSLEFPVPGEPDELMEITLPNQDFYQPPAAFEKKHRLTGIAHHYALPKGLLATEIESYISLLAHDPQVPERGCRSKTAAVWRALKNLNPELQGLHDERRHPALTHFYITGVTGAINPDDIRHFGRIYAGKQDPFAAMRDSSAYKNLDAIFNHCADIPWAASPKTLRKIERQVRADKVKGPL
jgi:hypothetical protein